MKPYLISLAAGLLVGAIYGLLNVRSPAPPVIALVGLLGILAGEQLAPLARHVLAGGSPNVAWLMNRAPHMFGHLPASGAGKTPKPGEPRIYPPEPGDHA